ncbi:hypothetical protein DFH06DRAFT_1322441 [Mycena polygramma]|nr:hypothetical protein DFH06DRAFT_1322441 [Mycena polygramma]
MQFQPLSQPAPIQWVIPIFHFAEHHVPTFIKKPEPPTLHSLAHKRQCRYLTQLHLAKRGTAPIHQSIHGERVEQLWDLQRLQCGEPFANTFAFHQLQAALYMRYLTPSEFSDEDEDEYDDMPPLLDAEEDSLETGLVRGHRARDLSKL